MTDLGPVCTHMQQLGMERGGEIAEIGAVLFPALDLQ